MKKIISLLLVLTLVFAVSGTCLAAWENPFKTHGNLVEDAAEDFADAIENAAEAGPQNPKDFISTVSGLTKTFLGKLFGSFNATPVAALSFGNPFERFFESFADKVEADAEAFARRVDAYFNSFDRYF